MRSFSVAVLTTVAIFGSSGVAVAAPKDYCADLKGGNTGTSCVIALSDPAYSVSITIPQDYPDQKSVADWVPQVRDAFVNSAKGAGGASSLTVTPTEYTSSVPPRGTQAVVFKVVQTLGSASPQTTYKAFNWDQTYRKAIIWTAAPDDKQNTPLWRVDDPLKTVGPIVQAQLQQQLQPPPAAPPTPTPTPGQPTTTTPTTTTTTTPPPPPPPLPFAQAALYNPANYQNFAIVNDGVMFFFDQGIVLPASYGALQVLVPRSAIDPMIA
jgi:uncharacterized protein DUF3298